MPAPAPQIFAALGAFLASAAVRAAAAPPAVEAQASALGIGSCSLEGTTEAPVAGGSTAQADASVYARTPLPWTGGYVGGGVETGQVRFPGAAEGPGRLQDYAATLGVEYFLGDEPAAALLAHPGWYFERRASAQAWDIPVDLTSGVPIVEHLDGLAGFANARFYHHAIPVAGFVWTPTAAVRVEAAIPEPAVIFTLGKSASLRLGGELDGGGYLADGTPRRTPVEYSSYRAGAALALQRGDGPRLTLCAGVELDRSFDYFRTLGRLHGGGAAYLKLEIATVRSRP